MYRFLKWNNGIKIFRGWGGGKLYNSSPSSVTYSPIPPRCPPNTGWKQLVTHADGWFMNSSVLEQLTGFHVVEGYGLFFLSCSSRCIAFRKPVWMSNDNFLAYSFCFLLIKTQWINISPSSKLHFYFAFQIVQYNFPLSNMYVHPCEVDMNGCLYMKCTPLPKEILDMSQRIILNLISWHLWKSSRSSCKLLSFILFWL